MLKQGNNCKNISSGLNTRSIQPKCININCKSSGSIIFFYPDFLYRSAGKRRQWNRIISPCSFNQVNCKLIGTIYSYVDILASTTRAAIDRDFKRSVWCICPHWRPRVAMGNPSRLHSQFLLTLFLLLPVNYYFCLWYLPSHHLSNRSSCSSLRHHKLVMLLMGAERHQ